MSLKIDLAACGRFHFHKFLPFLYSKGVLNRFYCSYRLNYDFKVPPGNVKNYFLKEYLMYVNIRFFKRINFEKNLYLLHRLWENQVACNKVSADLLHIMIHGNGEKIIRKYRDGGKVVVGEAVNVHPEVYTGIMEREFEKFGLRYSENRKMKGRMIREFELCDFILCPSGFVLDSFLSQGFERERLLVLPYGADTLDSPSPEKKRDRDRLKILCIGQITFRKGQYYLLKAVQELKKSIPFDLTLLGAPDKVYLDLLKREDLLKEVTLIGHVDNSQIHEFLKEYDLFILPSLEDGFGVVVTEALSAGIPALVSRACGASEVIDEGRNGFTFPPGSSGAIKETLLKARDHNFTMDLPMTSWEDYSGGLINRYSEAIRLKNGF